MAAPLVISTIFTAQDRMTVPVLRMRNAMEELGVVTARADRAFNKFAPNFGSDVKNRIGFLVSLAKAMAVIGTVTYAAKALVDFEKELSGLKALTGVTGAEFEKFKTIIIDTAKVTQTSAVDVAQSFTTIANAMPQLLGDAAGLGAVTSAAIMLGRAARMDLAPAAESLTLIMQQFNKTAAESTMVVDMLAAGSKYGSAEIDDLAASLREFGADARLINVTLAESVALTEAVSKFRKGSQAGTELRNVLTYMGTLKVQDPKALNDMRRLGVNMGIVTDKSRPLYDRLYELKKIVGDDAAIFHIFGKENKAMAQTVLENLDKFKVLLNNMSETGNAARMAKENTDNFKGALDRLKAGWTNLVVSSDKANWGLKKLAGFLGFITNHMETIINIATPFIAVYVAWKGVIWGTVLAQKAVTAAIWGYNVAVGVSLGLTGNFSTLLLTSRPAWYAYVTGAYAASAATSYFGTTLTSVLSVVSALALGLGLIWHYRKSIAQSANDSKTGRTWNWLIDDKQALKETAERKYMEDSAMTMRYYRRNPDEFTDEIRQSFRKIDAGQPLGDDNDQIINERRFEAEKDKALAPKTDSPVVNITINQDKYGNFSFNAGSGNGTSSVNTKQTGWQR